MYITVGMGRGGGRREVCHRNNDLDDKYMPLVGYILDGVFMKTYYVVS